MRIARTAALVVLAGCLLAVAGVARAGPSPVYDPFRIPRERFRAEVEKIALRPMRFPSSIPESDRLGRLVDHFLAKELEALGIEVVGADEFQSRWVAFSEQLGGVYDPATGKVDDDRFEIVQEYTMRALIAEFDVDGVIHPTYFRRSVSVHRAGYAMQARDTRLTWDGQPIFWHDGLPNWPQRVDGGWLGVEIQDAAGATIFDIGCFINWTVIYMARGFQKRDLDEAYDEGRIEKAVGCALGGFEE